MWLLRGVHWSTGAFRVANKNGGIGLPMQRALFLPSNLTAEKKKVHLHSFICTLFYLLTTTALFICMLLKTASGLLRHMLSLLELLASPANESLCKQKVTKAWTPITLHGGYQFLRTPRNGKLASSKQQRRLEPHLGFLKTLPVFFITGLHGHFDSLRKSFERIVYRVPPPIVGT